MQWCMATMCYDSCTFYEWCNVNFYADHIGEEQDWSCESFEEYFFSNNDTNSTNDTDCEDVYIDLTCGNFTMLNDSECWIWGTYNRCNDSGWQCTVSGYNESGYYYDDCSAEFEDAEFWSLMRLEQFWFDNWDMYYDFYEFWEEYHQDSNNTDRNCTQECYDPYDCSAETGLDYCSSEECWNSCDYSEGWCIVNFYHDGADMSMDCEEFHDYWFGTNNDTNNDTDCEDVYIDLTCGNFTMLNESQCWIYGKYNRCNDSGWDCSVSGYNESGYYYDDCSAEFEDAEFWSEMREEQFWFDNWDMYYDFYEFWDEYHSGSNNETDDDENVCESDWIQFFATCSNFSLFEN